MSRIVAAMVLVVVLAGGASAQRRVERFEIAGSSPAAEYPSAVHADWRARTTVLVVGGVLVGVAAGAVSAAADCAGEAAEGMFGGEHVNCDSAMPMIIIGGIVGGFAGFLIDHVIEHPHDSTVAP